MRARAMRSEALALLRIGEDFSPSACVMFLRAYHNRLKLQVAAVHRKDDKEDLTDCMKAVEVQIRALDARPSNDPAVLAARGSQ